MPIYMPIAEISLDIFLLIALGLGVGVLSGMFGIGGGFILTPMLIMLGVPALVAVGTGAAQVAATSAAGAVGHWRNGNVDLRMGSLLIGGGVLGSISGVGLQVFLKSIGQLEFFIAMTYVIMLGTIGLLMLIESLRALRATTAERLGAPAQHGGHHTRLQRLPIKMRFPTSKIYASAIPPLAIGLLVGWLTAIMGIGGGFLLVPALIYVLRIPTRIAIGTSIFQIIFVTAITTALQSVQNQNVDLMLGLPLMIGGVVGAQQGLRFAQRIKAEQLRILLAVLVLAVAVKMAFGLVLTPSDLFTIEVP